VHWYLSGSSGFQAEEGLNPRIDSV